MNIRVIRTVAEAQLLKNADVDIRWNDSDFFDSNDNSYYDSCLEAWAVPAPDGCTIGWSVEEWQAEA